MKHVMTKKKGYLYTTINVPENWISFKIVYTNPNSISYISLTIK
jgi:hypothetical protein